MPTADAAHALRYAPHAMADDPSAPTIGVAALNEVPGTEPIDSGEERVMSDFTKVRYTPAVLDLGKSTEYYTSVLGLGVDFTAPGWTFLSRGSFRVMLGECAPMPEGNRT
jgi:hypothetical protein